MKQELFYILNKTAPHLSFKIMSLFLAIWGRIKCIFPNIDEKVYAGDSTLREEMDKFMRIFMDDSTLADENKCNSVRKDMIKCYYLYGINPNEYFLHQFDKKDRKTRKTYISKRDKNIYCRLAEGQKEIPMKLLNDKGLFYEVAKKWFKREVCIVKSGEDKNAFLDFLNHTQSFIAKPISGSWGAGCQIYRNAEAKVFDELMSGGGYILEELIQQDERMSKWNPSSVNTVRICSFRKHDGSTEQLFPFFKTGRQGSVVDNAGQGGVYASVDACTGVICTDGMDENGHTYKEHPDSKITFVGWQIPCWNELMEMASKIHQSLPEGQKYVGFDFALSKDKGWLVVEGNWGDFICQQSSLHRGIRKEIMCMYNEIA